MRMRLRFPHNSTTLSGTSSLPSQGTPRMRRPSSTTAGTRHRPTSRSTTRTCRSSSSSSGCATSSRATLSTAVYDRLASASSLPGTTPCTASNSTLATRAGTILVGGRWEVLFVGHWPRKQRHSTSSDARTQPFGTCWSPPSFLAYLRLTHAVHAHIQSTLHRIQQLDGHESAETGLQGGHWPRGGSRACRQGSKQDDGQHDTGPREG